MDYLLICLIGLLAFYLKGITGTGTATVIVAFSSLIIDPKMAVVLAALVNVFGGFAMLRVDPVPFNRRFLLPVIIWMMMGAVIGATSLKIIDPKIFEIILGIAFLVVSARFVFAKPHAMPSPFKAPDKARWIDQACGLAAGFCGGFIGVNAPLLVSHFGRILDKQYLRHFLVIIFIPAAIVHTSIFYANGLLTPQIMLYGVAILPFMALGIFLGNKSFGKISDVAFKRILAVFLVIVSLRLIF
jgi:uncharacterized membrane protein YfcA